MSLCHVFAYFVGKIILAGEKIILAGGKIILAGGKIILAGGKLIWQVEKLFQKVGKIILVCRKVREGSKNKKDKIAIFHLKNTIFGPFFNGYWVYRLGGNPLPPVCGIFPQKITLRIGGYPHPPELSLLLLSKRSSKHLKGHSDWSSPDDQT